MSTHIKEKYTFEQNLQKGSQDKDVKIEQLNKKLEEEKIHFQAIVLDCTKKDEVIKALGVKVRQNTLKTKKNRKKSKYLSK